MNIRHDLLKSFNHNQSLVCRCSRCSGIGFIRIYSHIQGGICFQCYGTGVFAGTAINSKSIRHTDVNPQTKRWFLGYLNQPNRLPKQIFAFTAADLKSGKSRAAHELSAQGLGDDLNSCNFQLIIGGIAETKKEILSRYTDYLTRVIENSF